MGLVFRVFNYTFTVAQLALVVHTRMVFLCLFLCIALKLSVSVSNANLLSAGNRPTANKESTFV